MISGELRHYVFSVNRKMLCQNFVEWSNKGLKIGVRFSGALKHVSITSSTHVWLPLTASRQH